MLRSNLMAGLAVAGLALMAVPALAQAPDGAPLDVQIASGKLGPTLDLSVTGSVDSAPDMATLTTGVQTRAPTAKDAMAQNAVLIDKLVAALLKSGIARKDIQTSGINLNQQFDYSGQRDGSPPRFVGYEASNQLAVVIRTIAKAGETVDAMVAAGATNINGPVFGITDMEAVRTQARGKALRTAQDRATFYAQAAGFKGARLLSISENADYMPPRPMVMRAMVADAPATKIEPGQVTNAVTLNLRYVLER